MLKGFLRIRELHLVVNELEATTWSQHTANFRKEMNPTVRRDTKREVGHAYKVERLFWKWEFIFNTAIEELSAGGDFAENNTHKFPCFH